MQKKKKQSNTKNGDNSDGHGSSKNSNMTRNEANKKKPNNKNNSKSHGRGGANNPPESSGGKSRRHNNKKQNSKSGANVKPQERKKKGSDKDNWRERGMKDVVLDDKAELHRNAKKDLNSKRPSKHGRKKNDKNKTETANMGKSRNRDDRKNGKKNFKRGANKRGQPKKQKEKPRGWPDEKNEFEFHEKFVFRNLPPDMTQEEFLILLERSAGVVKKKKPLEKPTKEAVGLSTSGVKEAQAAQSKGKSTRDSSVEDVGSKLEGTKISEANEGPAVEESEDKVKKVIDDYRKKLEGQLQFVQPWDRNIPGIMNEYTYFSPGKKNRVDNLFSTPSKAWVVFIDEKVRDMVFGKFGGEKGQLVKSKRGTTTRVFMKKAFYQGIPHSSQCLPPKNDGIEGTIFTDPDFINGSEILLSSAKRITCRLLMCKGNKRRRETKAKNRRQQLHRW